MTRKLRIVHCFRSPVGGIFRHVRDLVEAHAAKGHEVGIVCDSSTGGELEDSLFDAISGSLALGIAREPMQRHIGPGDVMAAWRTFRHIRRLRPDILHGHGSKGGAYARVFGTLMRMGGHRVARVYSPHGGVLHYAAESTGGRFLFSLERALDRISDYIIFVSRHEADTYARKVGPPRAPFAMVHNGLRPEEFSDPGLAEDAADFLYVGMMRDLKGPDIMIEAMAMLSQATGRQPGAVMVGDGDDLARYREMARGLGLDRAIRFHDPMPARQAFRLGRVVVVPSRAEAMPYIVLEALAARRPMIASAVGGIPEVFGVDSPALIAPETGALAGKMQEVLADPEGYAAAMPDADDLRRRFGAEFMAAKIEEIYLRIATA